MVRGLQLYIEGEQKYMVGRILEAFELYRQAAVQILNHEDVLQKAGGNMVPEQAPQEILAIVWINLLGCFKSDDGRFTQEAYPEAYDLVYSFRPTSSSKAHPQFKGPQGQRLLKMMQILAGFALAILAWKKALDVAATHPPFNAVVPGQKHLDYVAAHDVQEMRDNLAMLIANDSFTAGMVGQGALRKEVLDAPNGRLGVNGELTPDNTFVVATDACGRAGCSKRGVKFKRCSACKKTAYCSVECQKEDWKKHKLTHK
ncbi:hypothetical protein B0H14DRAFT_2955196 [Mycena olivaceomarginata]|nr:hypothetical protein B0H14DRAFT_2955196 [Mycena olivaceomarginata]